MPSFKEAAALAKPHGGRRLPSVGEYDWLGRRREEL